LELVKKNFKKITLTEYILLDESLISDTKYLNEIAKKFLNYEKTDDLNDKINSKYDSMFVIGNTNFVLELMPILTYYDLDLTHTDILGTSILNDKLLINEHSLINAKFPMVRQNQQNEFEKKWKSLWPSRPNELSRLGYDLSKISMWVVNQNDPFITLIKQNKNKFSILGNKFIFYEDGSVFRPSDLFKIKSLGKIKKINSCK